MKRLFDWSCLLGASALSIVACSGASAPSPSTPPPPPAPAPRACTEIGCEDGLRIELVRAAWPAGNYRVQLDVDGTTTTCSGQLPLRPCEQGPSFNCEGAPVRFGESGCALPAEAHSITDINLPTTSAQRVTLTLEHDGALIGTTTLTPEYNEQRPNGPDCPPVCRNAGLRLKLR